ncbi:MAG: peptidoglycan recognition family protein [Actinomycetaceae bacterium]|nr:peptidoglycan recognition family protein [Actinomycetaceae bacterium]
MAYTYITDRTSPNRNAGRQGNKITGIVIHWWGDPATRPSFQGVVDWLCRNEGNSSAHYVVEAGKVACIVDPEDTAWHAGNLSVNRRTIGIECNPRMTQGDLETVAELIADLRSVYGRLPLSLHSDHSNTACPGTYAGKLGWLDRRAEEIRKGTTPAKPTAPAAPAAPAKPKKLVEDGVWGTLTTYALQFVLGTPQDGVVSSQYAPNMKYLPAAGSGWVWTGAAAVGSKLIVKLQQIVGAYADGIMGPDTVKKLQKWLGVTVDGYMGPITVTPLQKWINRKLGY